MAFYQLFNIIRSTEPDLAQLVKLLQANVESTIGVRHDNGTPLYVLKKNTDWTPTQINAATTVIQNAIALTEQSIAQNQADNLDIILKAVALVMIDEINILRAQHSLAPRTVQQAIQAIRNKAGSL